MADRDIITRAGKGSDLDATDHDQNHKSFAGTVEEQTGTTYTVLYTDQNKTIELNNASMVCTLTAISTIHSQIDTDNFEVTLINTNATAATVNRSSTNTFTGGGTSLTLLQNQSVTLQTDSTGGVWQFKGENNTDSINTTGNNQRIDASGTTEEQNITLGASGLTGYSRLSLEADSGAAIIQKSGTLNALNDVLIIYSGSDHSILFRTGASAATKASVRHDGGIAIVDDAPATPAANTLYADSMVKAWVYASLSGSTYTLQADVNVSSIADGLAGYVQVNLATAVANVNTTIVQPGIHTGARMAQGAMSSTSQASIVMYDNTNTAADAEYTCTIIGRQ